MNKIKVGDKLKTRSGQNVVITRLGDFEKDIYPLCGVVDGVPEKCTWTKEGANNVSVQTDFDLIIPNQPERTWVGLTNDELKLLSAKWRLVYGAWVGHFARDIEQTLKDKNT